MPHSRIPTLRIPTWALVEKWLCELVTRLGTAGYRHTLEVEVRLTEPNDDRRRCELTEFLPGFREKGVVTIIDAARDLVLYSSAGGRWSRTSPIKQRKNPP